MILITFLGFDGWGHDPREPHQDPQLVSTNPLHPTHSITYRCKYGLMFYAELRNGHSDNHEEEFDKEQTCFLH